MHHCDHCDESVDLPFQCNYCSGRFCSNHRLPEGHECDGVEFLSGSQRWFRDKSTGTVISSESEFERPEPIEPGTVGTSPDPEFESVPEVKLRSNSETENRNFVGRLLRRLFGK